VADSELPAKTAYYARFLSAGGTFTLADWRGILSEDDRAAAEAAGALLAAKRAALVAREVVALLAPPAPTPAQPDPVGEAMERAGRAALREASGGA